jgi:DNA invertase Pin-like site-specific DNA recombinase
MSAKIASSQLSRRAVVYLRQSTLKQVFEHGESTARQYALQERAAELGWNTDQIDIIDEDLGQSGSGTEHRGGFLRLAEAVAHGRVGAVFALEVSRLSRSSADWHRLLDLCALADTVICDGQAVFAPGDHNDRLVLGMKGTMSEAELYWMKLRLHGGRLNKARRGDLHFHAPAGYEWDADSLRFVQSPDERVRAGITQIFELFRLLGAATAVVRHCQAKQLLLPCRLRGNGPIHWKTPCLALVLHVLHNPIYAGAYAYGRTQERAGLVGGQVRRRVKKDVALANWAVCLRERHPGYITWEQFMANQGKLQDNRTTNAGQGAPKCGHALLQGLAMCGRCGHRMHASYPSGRHGHYQCQASNFTGRDCFSVSATEIDKAVERMFLEAMQPDEIDLSLAVTLQAERQAGELDKQWRLRLEQAQYGARLAERRYMAVDPDNRVVARTLERDWEEKLRHIAEIEQDYERARHQEKVVLSAEDRRQILALARDLPAVWRSTTTTDTDRKTLLRLAISEVVLHPIDVPQRQTRLVVQWHGGAVTEVQVPRQHSTMAQTTPVEALRIILQGVRDGTRDWQLADMLNEAGILTGRLKPWTVLAVQRVRYAEGLNRVYKSRRLTDQRADGMLSVHGVAARIGVAPSMVRMWRTQGLITAVEGGGTGKDLWFELTPEVEQELRTRASRSIVARAHRRLDGKVTQEG